MARGTGAQPPRRRRKDQRPAEILQAALALFAERGFSATRLDDVAERANAAKGTIYLYFPTKEALFEAVVREAFAAILDSLAQAMELPEVSSAALVRLLIERLYAELVDTGRREIVRLLVAESKRFPDLVAFYHREAVVRGRALLGEILQRGIARGEFRDGPATRSPETIVGPAIMAAVWKLVFDRVEPLDVEAMRAAHVDLVLAGIAAAPPGAPPT